MEEAVTWRGKLPTKTGSAETCFRFFQIWTTNSSGALKSGDRQGNRGASVAGNQPEALNRSSGAYLDVLALAHELAPHLP